MNSSTRNDKNTAGESTDTRIDHAADRAEEGLHHAADAGARSAHRVADKIGEWRDRGAEFASDTRDQADRMTKRLRELIRNKPIGTVAIILAAGWLAGRLLKSRD